MGKFSRLGNDLYNGKKSVDFVGRKWLWYAVSGVILLLAVLAKLLGSSVTLSSGWKGGFIIPLFFIGSCLAGALHIGVGSTDLAVLLASFMVACNVGVTKTPLGSVLVVTEMAGLTLLPATLVAALVSLVLTSNVGLIHTQRSRDLVDA